MAPFSFDSLTIFQLFLQIMFASLSPTTTTFVKSVYDTCRDVLSYYFHAISLVIVYLLASAICNFKMRWSIIFRFVIPKRNTLPLGPIRTPSPSTKEFHGWSIESTWWWRQRHQRREIASTPSTRNCVKQQRKRINHCRRWTMRKVLSIEKTFFLF